jgi:hypothetical protein
VSEDRPNIWRLQALADTQGLIKALEHSDPNIRERAAIALRTISAFDAIPAMRKLLTTEDNPDVRTIVTSALVHLLEEQQEEVEGDKPPSPPDEITLLIGQLASKEPNEIIHAAQALGALGDTLAVEPLVMLFNNGALPANVRLAAAEALIELKSPPTVVTALVALRRADGHLRRIAAAMLGHLEADWAVEPLRAALKDENELVRRTARAALKHINTPEAHQALESVPEHEPVTPPVSEATPPAAPSETPKVTGIVTELPAQVPVTVNDKPAETATPSTPPPASQPVTSGEPPEAKPAETPEPSAPAAETVQPVAESSQAKVAEVVETAAASSATPVEPTPEKSAPAANVPDASTPDAQPKPEWSVEQTRPSRPDGLDAANWPVT